MASLFNSCLLNCVMFQVLIIDSRSFLEYNTAHISEAVNVCCSKLVKRRLQHDKVRNSTGKVHLIH